MKSFIHLHTHSAYSLLEGALPIKKLLDLCKKNDMPALALTDTNNLFGALEYAMTAADSGIQPIIGVQIDLLNPFSAHTTSNTDATFQPIILLAKNEKGYRNILKLSSQSYIDASHRNKPYINLDQLKAASEGLILLSGGTHGPISTLLAQDKLDQAKEITHKLAQLFPENFYLELMRHGLPYEAKIEKGILQLAKENKLPIVATNDVYFSTPSDHKAHDALLCVAEGTYISVDERRHVTPEHYFKSADEMAQLFADLPQAIENTTNIAKRCSFYPLTENPILPPFTTESGVGEVEEIKKQATAGLKQRLDLYVYPLIENNTPEKKEEVKKKYTQRLDFELDVIIQMGFAGYFLIVSDFIKWAKSNNIPVGPGRGSGAGSLTAWCLQITDVDPIRFSLIFERFLNPERVSMPDFDVDFCQERRDEVINYVRKKYGQDHVAQIITYGKLQARAVLRDVGRVLQMPYTQVDRISKLVPNNPANPVTLAEALKAEPKLEEERQNDPMIAELIEISLQLEGLYRHASTHAAGVVIGDRPLYELVPLYRDPKSPVLVTQFNMKLVEKAGLVKFDFLGLKTLTVIEKASELIRAHHNKSFNISTVALDDLPTFELLRRVETVGIFQLESAGMSDVLRQLQPEQFDELIALVALYRPGPMDDIPQYLACRHGREPVTYMHPTLEPILKESFGVMVYQEQVMWIARELAGYSLGDADLLRRAMGKKIKSEMDKQRKIFIDGAAKNGVDKKLAEDIFDKIAKFASYAFPKAHATPYALLSYQTAFLKANYPLEFYASSMTLDAHNTEKINIFRQDMMKLGFPLLPPDINLSDVFFTVEKAEAVRYALSALKGVGASAMEEVVKERQAHGAYKSIWDFAARLSSKVINKKQLESLIASGAFDSLHENRRTLYESIDLILAYATKTKEAQSSNQNSLFGESDLPAHPDLPNLEPWPLLTSLELEYKAIGFYLSAHPLDAYDLALEKLNYQKYAEVLTLAQSASDEQTFPMVGVVLGKKEKMSKRGSRFAFVQLSDKSGAYETTVFSEALSTYGDHLEPGTAGFFQINARWDVTNEQLRLNIVSAQTLDQFIEQELHHMDFTIHTKEDLNTVLQKVAPTTGKGIKLSLRVPISVNDNDAKTIEVHIQPEGLYTLKN